jgi:hypothetical protein
MRRASVQRVLGAVVLASGLLVAERTPAQGYPPGLMPRARPPRIMDQTFQRPFFYPGPGVYLGPGILAPSTRGGVYMYPPMGDSYGAIPQTRKYKYPAPQYEVPKMGLQYLYPYGPQFGLQMPAEPDEPVPYDEQGRGRPGFRSPALSQAADLMRQGKYMDAGRLLARDLDEDTAAPEQYLAIAEALWAAGKADDAAIVLRQAVETAPTLDFLDQADLPGKFASPDALKAKVQSSERGGDLLQGTMNILAGQREKGLDILRGAAQQDPAARRVYLHYLGAAFGAQPAAAPEKPAPEKAPAEKPAPEKAPPPK